LITRAAETPPRELAAIGRKASAPRAQDRYEHVDELIEDVRRYLDGKSVSAEQDTLLLALVRFARRSPAAAAIVAATLVVALLIPGLSAARVRRDWLATHALEDEAVNARVQSARARDLATTARERAARTTELAQGRRAFDDALDTARAARLGGKDDATV